MRNPYFKSAVGPRPDSFSEPGSPIRTIYEPFFDGKKTDIKAVGEQNTDELIQAQAPFTDLAYMMSRLKVGDKSVLSSKPATYGDFSQLPDNPADVINAVNHAQDSFLTLPTSERAKYGNDWRVWYTAINQPRPVAPPVAPDSPPVNPVVEKDGVDTHES